MKIIDCFTFFNEIDMLYYRLSLLDEYVDYFVIAEATKTHTGKYKPSYFLENVSKFEKFADKIIFLQDPDLETDPLDAWPNEKHQRNYLQHGIQHLNLSPDDYVIISDLDEIPNPTILQKLRSGENDLPHGTGDLQMDFYYYNLTCKIQGAWGGKARIATYEFYKNCANEIPENLRNMPDNLKNIKTTVFQNGGWHLSYFGDANFISNKIQNFAHKEFDNQNFTDLGKIEFRVKNHLDAFDRHGSKMDYIPIHENTNLPPRYAEFLGMFLGDQN